MGRKLERIMRRWLTVLLTGWLCFSLLPVADGFMAFDHRLKPHLKRKMNNLIRRVHKEQWTIGYRYADNCAPGARNNGQAIEEAITASLNAWLQPVRELNTGKPVVDDFRYVPNLVFPLQEDERKLYDLVIEFYCDRGTSHALVGADEAKSPFLKMHRGTFVDDQFAGVLLHEIGHAFGLNDTYTNPKRIANEELRVSRGGIGRTIGHQPGSVMSSHNVPLPHGTGISQDDANGIIWLYKFYHENLALEDCIFPDYELEKNPDGCRPKHPLLFEIKYGREDIAEFFALEVMRDDANTDINAKDGEGMTALHYAVIKGYPQLVDKLLEHEGLDVNSADGSGMTALHYAVREKFTDGVRALLTHEDIDVNSQDGNGLTALHYAVKGRFTDGVEWLLGREDLDVEVEDKDGVTALALANQLGYTELADLISPPIEPKSVRLRNNLATVWGALKVR